MNKYERISLLATIDQGQKPHILDLLSSNKPDAISKIRIASLTQTTASCVVYIHKIARADQSFLIRWFQHQKTAIGRVRAVPLHTGYAFTFSSQECELFLEEYSSRQILNPDPKRTQLGRPRKTRRKREEKEVQN